jgi:PAS domain S-box-containing protein
VLNKRATEIYQVDIAPYLEIYSDTAYTGKTVSFETYFAPLKKYFRISVISPKKQEFISVFDDISDRKENEFRLKKQSEDLSTLNSIIALGNESTSLQEFLHKSYDRVLESAGFDRGGVYLYDPKTQHNILVHHKNVHSDFVVAVENVDISEGLFSSVFDKNNPFYIEDFSGFMENSKELGIYSAVIVPLRSKDKYVGSLNLGSSVHQELSQNELDLLVAIGKQMGIIIQKFESEKLLIESEEKFRTLFEKADEGIILADTETEQVITANNKICEMLGYPLEELKTMRFADLHPKETLHYIDERFGREIDEFSLVNDIPMKRKDGSVFYCNVNSSQIEIADQPYFLGFYSDVTNRMEAEQKLKESEEKFRSIAEYSDAEISIIQDGVFKYINQKALDTLGYMTEEIELWEPYELIEKIIHPNQRENVLRLTEDIQSGEKDYMLHDEIQFIDKFGNNLWLDTYTRSITFQGRPAVLSCALNITEKKKSEDKLKESEKILKDFIHNATDSISIWDENLNLIESNDVAVDPWNSPNKPIRGIPMEELAPRIKETSRYDQYLEVIKTGIPISFDNVEIPPQMGERYFNLKAFKVGRGLGIIGTEITEHIRFEQELRESEEKFRTIAEQSFMGIVIMQDGMIQYMNKVLANMAEYPIDEMLKHPDLLITKMIHPDDVEYLLKRLQSNIEGTMSPLSKNAFRIITPSGEIRWLEDYTSKIIYQGKEANLIAVIDATDKKQAEQLIIEENKRLLELEELRKDIITRVSHELKTPMTSIYGANQILTRLYADEIGEEAKKYIEIGLRGSLRMKQLIDNLLDVSRLDDKKLGLRLQEENLVELVIDCIKDMSYLATDRQLKIKLELPNEVYHNIDRLRFRQVLSNIISNAIKNTPKLGEILISIIEDTKDVTIQIKDTGVGITENEKGKLFEKFGKIERYGMDLGVDIEGSGLGLYISKEIVELHGGHIYIESEGRNKGTTVSVRLFKI